MPVTKKKGAIFAIYADSPAKTTRSLGSASAASTKSITQPSSSTTNPASRPALGSKPSVPLAERTVQDIGKGKEKPKAARAKGDAEDAGSSKPVKPSVNVKTPKPLTSTMVKRTISTKRQLEIFRAPAEIPAEPSAAGPASPTLLSASPVKRTRTGPTQRTLPRSAEKENAPPTDSPASRTRSRTSVSRHALAGSPLQSMRILDMASAEHLVGDGRGTLTLKKGRKVASVMKGLAVRGDGVLADVSEAYGAAGDAPAGFHTQRR